MLRSVRIDDVFVTSDCEDILKAAASFGAKTILRPAELSSDTNSLESAWIHALEQIKGNGVNPDLLVLAQATSPVRNERDFDEAIETFYEQSLDSLFSCNVFDDFNYWEMESGKYFSVNYDYNKRLRRQNIKKKYHENGSFYLTKPEILTIAKNRLEVKLDPYDA